MFHKRNAQHEYSYKKILNKAGAILLLFQLKKFKKIGWWGVTLLISESSQSATFSHHHSFLNIRRIALLSKRRSITRSEWRSFYSADWCRWLQCYLRVEGRRGKRTSFRWCANFFSPLISPERKCASVQVDPLCPQTVRQEQEMTVIRALTTSPASLLSLYRFETQRKQLFVFCDRWNSVLSFLLLFLSSACGHIIQ